MPCAAACCEQSCKQPRAPLADIHLCSLSRSGLSREASQRSLLVAQREKERAEKERLAKEKEAAELAAKEEAEQAAKAAAKQERARIAQVVCWCIALRGLR